MSPFSTLPRNSIAQAVHTWYLLKLTRISSSPYCGLHSAFFYSRIRSCKDTLGIDKGTLESNCLQAIVVHV